MRTFGVWLPGWSLLLVAVLAVVLDVATDPWVRSTDGVQTVTIHPSPSPCLTALQHKLHVVDRAAYAYSQGHRKIGQRWYVAMNPALPAGCAW